MFPNPYFPESQGQAGPTGIRTANNRRAKGASRTKVIPAP